MWHPLDDAKDSLQGAREVVVPGGASRSWVSVRNPVEQLEQLGDVVAVAAGERPGERDTAAVYEERCLPPRPPRRPDSILRHWPSVM
jgi:hypothetical protein